jgi:hypothetical protein
MALPGTTAAPHFDRTAFRVARNYATLAPDGNSANFKFSPNEQELKCLVAPEAFSPIDNAWGRQGWTCALLRPLSVAELRAALEMAWRHAQPGRKPVRKPVRKRRGAR